MFAWKRSHPTFAPRPQIWSIYLSAGCLWRVEVLIIILRWFVYESRRLRLSSPNLPQILYFVSLNSTRTHPLPHKSILVHSAQKNSHNFIVFAEMMQMEQKIVDFFSIKVYLRIKIWIQNQISKIINQKRKSKTLSKEIGIFIYWVWEAGKGKRIYGKSKT